MPCISVNTYIFCISITRKAESLHLMISKQFPKNLMITALLTLIYFSAGKLGLMLAFVNPSATAVWAPTGIALAAFMILGKRAAPGILAGGLAVNLSTSGSLPASIMIAVGNTL